MTEFLEQPLPEYMRWVMLIIVTVVLLGYGFFAYHLIVNSKTVDPDPKL